MVFVRHPHGAARPCSASIHALTGSACARCRRLPCRSGCTVPFRGGLRPGIHRLQHLTYLYLDGNDLSGTLPLQWGEPHGFPALLEL